MALIDIYPSGRIMRYMIVKYDQAYHAWLSRITEEAKYFDSDLICEIEDQINQMLLIKKQDECYHNIKYVGKHNGWFKSELFECTKCNEHFYYGEEWNDYGIYEIDKDE